MKKALNIPDLIESKTVESKGIEFTHELKSNSGYWSTCDTPQHPNIDRIVYLGYCQKDGDMFAVYSQESYITIYKGHLNDGTY